MPTFRSPQVVLFSRDVERAAAFYAGLGFTEVFRTPADGPPIHVDLELDGYRVGIAAGTSVCDDHGLDPVVSGQRAAVVLWTDDVPAALDRMRALGAAEVKRPAPWLDRLLVAWAEDLDGHLVQVVQEAG